MNEASNAPRPARARPAGRRVGALIRAYHADSTHLPVLAAQLAEAGFDAVMIVADETRGPVEAHGFPKLSHTTETVAALGLRMPPRTLWYCGDYAYYATVMGRRDADFWLMIEYDVGLRRPKSRFWQGLYRRLSAPRYRGVDLLSGYLGPYDRPHFRHDYAEPWKGFFALTGLSARAIDTLFEARLREARRRTADPRGAFCEVFIASELVAAGGFGLLDINTLVPGSVDRPGFGPYRAVPVGHEAWMPGSGALVHRVLDMWEYLSKGPLLAVRYKRVDDFLRELDQLRAEGLPREQADLAAEVARSEAARVKARDTIILD